MKNFIREMKNDIKSMIFESYKTAFMNDKLPMIKDFECEIEIPKEKQFCYEKRQSIKASSQKNCGRNHEKF